MAVEDEGGGSGYLKIKKQLNEMKYRFNPNKRIMERAEVKLVDSTTINSANDMKDETVRTIKAPVNIYETNTKVPIIKQVLNSAEDTIMSVFSAIEGKKMGFGGEGGG